MKTAAIGTTDAGSVITPRFAEVGNEVFCIDALKGIGAPIDGAAPNPMILPVPACGYAAIGRRP